MKTRRWLVGAILCVMACVAGAIWTARDRTEHLRGFVDNGDRPSVVYDLILESGRIASVRVYIAGPESDGKIDGAQEEALQNVKFDGQSVSFSVQVRPTLSRPYVLRVRDHGGYEWLDITYYDGYTDSVLMSEVVE